jgi:hypothetical protein
LEGRKAEKDRFLHIFPAFLPSKESVLRSVSGNRISTKKASPGLRNSTQINRPEGQRKSMARRANGN